MREQLMKIQENSEEEKESNLIRELKEVRAQIKLKREMLEEIKPSNSNPSNHSDSVVVLENYSAPSLSSSNLSSTSSMFSSPVSDIVPDDEDKGIQKEFECPISTCIMEDPVVTSTGISYERQFIEEWLALQLKQKKEAEEKGEEKEEKIRDANRNILSDTTLRPNITLKNVIQHYQETKDVNNAVLLNCICPLSRKLIKNPVVAADGYSYEYKEIKEWFAKNTKSPVTRKSLSDHILWPNLALKNVIDRVQKTPHMLNESQRDTIKDLIINQVVKNLCPQPNVEQLYEALIDSEPGSPLLLQIINQQEPGIRDLLIHARQLILGNDIFAKKNDQDEYSVLEQLPAPPSILEKDPNFGNAEAKDIANYARECLVNNYQLVARDVNRVHSALDHNQLNNLGAVIMHPQEDGLPKRFFIAMGEFFCGVGRGIYNFIIHNFVDPLTLIYKLISNKDNYRAHTWEGLRSAFRNPKEFFKLLWNNLRTYARTDKVAFGTELVLTLGVIALFIALPTAGPAGPGAAAAINTLEKLPVMSAMTKVGAGISQVSKVTSPVVQISRMASIATPIVSSLTPLAKVSSIVVPTLTATTLVTKQTSIVPTPGGTPVKETKNVVPFKDLPWEQQARIGLEQPQVRLVTEVLKKRLINQIMQNNFKPDKVTPKVKINMFDEPKFVYVNGQKPGKVKINMFASVKSVQFVPTSTSKTSLDVVPVPKLDKVEKEKSMGPMAIEPTSRSSSVVPLSVSISSTAHYRLVGAPANKASSSSLTSPSSTTNFRKK